jgi:hypothetical protein
MNPTLKKFAWGGLFVLVFAAGILTSFTPTAAEICCKKMCAHGTDAQKAWHETHKDAETCCKRSCKKK